MSDLQQQIDRERQEARNICNAQGAESQECAVAWDTVEELQAAASHQKEQGPKKTSLEKYCDANPDADECRVYDD